MMESGKAVVTKVEGLVAYASTMCLDRCIALAEKLEKRIWNDCNGKTLITLEAAKVS